ncbi:hypothetical protein FRC20_000811 [Serendipita sp. 405]|nr:hypothetical protein FRC20_000811 [Serendipita sp. 405]
MSSSEREPLLSSSSSLKKANDVLVAASARSPSPSPSLLKDESPPKTPNQVSRRKLAWVLGASWTAVFLAAMDGTIVATSQQPIGEYFKQSNKASYIGTSYLLSLCCFTPLYGRLSDILGRKGAMLLAMTFFTFGTSLCGIAPSMEVLIAARAIAGMGGGGLNSVSTIILSDLIPLRNRGLFQGLGNIVFGVGAGLGGSLGGYIVDTFGWRTVFLFQIPLLLIASILIAAHVDIVLPRAPLTLKQKLARIDWLGSATLVGFISGLLIGLNLKETEDLTWSDRRVYGLLVVSALSLGAFVFVESKISLEPVMPMKLLLSRTPLSVALTNFFGSIVSFSVLYNVPLYFMAVRLQTAGEAGLHLLPNSIAISLGSLGTGWIMRHTGKYYWLIVGSTSLSLIATILIARWDQNGPSQFHSWIDIVPNGLGFASALTSTLVAIIACVPREDMAVATGITYLFRTTGQVLGVSLSGTIFQAVLMSKLRERIQGPNAREIIEAVRHDASIVRTLEGAQRQAAVESFALALRVVFFCQVAIATLTLISAIAIEEHPLPDSHEEHEKRHKERRNSDYPTEEA